MRWALNKFLIPENVAVGLLIKNSFISDLQQETICRYNDKIKKNALMCREEVDWLLYGGESEDNTEYSSSKLSIFEVISGDKC